MKFSGQSKHGSIDNLLRAYASRPSDSHQMCPDFDPDRANSYIERSLTGASRVHYEAHLSECGSCRKSVVALVRLAETDAPSSVVPRREAAKSTWLSGALSGAKQLFGALSQPRWAMASAAVVVLAISLPVLLSHNPPRDASQAIVESEKPQSAMAPASPASGANSGDVATVAAPSKQAGKLDENPEALAGNAPAARKKTDASAPVGGVAVAAKAPEAATVSQSADQEQRKVEGQLAQAPAQAGGAPGSQVARNEADQNRQQQAEKDSAQQPGDTKALARADEPGKKENERRVDEIAPPPAASSSEVARSRAGLKPPARLALRDSAGEAVRTEERRLSGKKFFFRDGAWTDKDFNPNKDLPVVTIIRDSNVYKELIAKRSGLRSIMERFGSTERAVIVYKGTVYKLIPQ